MGMSFPVVATAGLVGASSPASSIQSSNDSYWQPQAGTSQEDVAEHFQQYYGDDVALQPGTMPFELHIPFQTSQGASVAEYTYSAMPVQQLADQEQLYKTRREENRKARRRQQNRAAQHAYRLRQIEGFKKLQEDHEQLSAQHKKLQASYKQQVEKTAALEQKLMQLRHNAENPAWPDAGGFSVQNRNHSSQMR